MTGVSKVQAGGAAVGETLTAGEVVVAYTVPPPAWPPGREAELLRCLPADMRSRHARFVQQGDRDGYLLARLLLVSLLDDRERPAVCLDGWGSGPHGKPALAAGQPELSLSHSRGLVACALSAAGPVGLDVETHRAIDLDDFRSFLSPAQWQAITAAAAPTVAFYELWTALESVLKAAGVGLSRQPSAVILDDSRAVLDGVSWHLRRLELGAGFSAHLACAREPSRIGVRRCAF